MIKQMVCIDLFMMLLLNVMFNATYAFATSQRFYLQFVEVDWQILSASTQKQIVQEYVNALDSFALAMPIVGGDTESTWAADTIHTMAQEVREKQHPFLENMADIYQIHNYIAYGMSYFNAIIGLPHDTTKLCNFVLKDMLASSDFLHQTIIADDYKNNKTWNVLRFESILNMQIFN